MSALPMTEDQLLTAITDALTLFGWRWSHARRSDRALMQGHPGVPDILAVRGNRLLAWELKARAGVTSNDQILWLDGLMAVGAEARVIRPADLDAALEWIR